MARSSWLTAVCVACAWGLVAAPASAATRLERIRQRGSVVCGGESGLRFGPIMFYDGQGFLVAKRLGTKSVQQLSGVSICVERGTLSDTRLQS
ncbi:MAG: hypothetical protein EXQ48_05640, partial [Acidobacteria bacterium]|nr:hypothetical protein [Acidobacteriota bacterium]